MFPVNINVPIRLYSSAILKVFGLRKTILLKMIPKNLKKIFFY